MCSTSYCIEILPWVWSITVPLTEVLFVVYFAGLDQALEGCHARVTLIAIPLKCEWNPFVVGSLLMLFVSTILCCLGMLGPWQTTVPLALKRMWGFKVDAHTHCCIMHIACRYPNNESTVHIPAIYVMILSYRLDFSYCNSTSLVWLMLGHIIDFQKRCLLYLHTNIYAHPRQSGSVWIINKVWNGAGAEISGHRQVRVQLQSNK